jgi:toxin CcdB
VPTVVIAPLLVDDGRSAYSMASVRVEFRSAAYVLSVPELAGVDRAVLGRSLGDLLSYEDDIRRALDRIFTGF